MNKKKRHDGSRRRSAVSYIYLNCGRFLAVDISVCLHTRDRDREREEESKLRRKKTIELNVLTGRAAGCSMGNLRGLDGCTVLALEGKIRIALAIANVS